MKIGDTIYLFLRDNQNRIDGDGKHKALWAEHKIFGQSPTHWHVGEKSWATRKVRKSNLYEAGRSGYCGYQWFTTEGKVDKEYRSLHARKIALDVELDATADQLKQIAAIVGYKEN